MSKEPRVSARASARCPFCHDAITPSVAKTGCEACMAWHHIECWDQHGRCSACGHQRPKTHPFPPQALPAPKLGHCEHEGCRAPALGASEADYCATLCASHALEQLSKNRRAGNVFFIASLTLLALAIYETWDEQALNSILGMGLGILALVTSFVIFGFRKIKGIEQFIWLQDQPKANPDQRKPNAET